MIQRDELLTYLNEYLRIREFKDYCPNGLQVEGKLQIDTVVTGVSISKLLIEQAIALNADLILVHHGLIWRSNDWVIRGWWKDRLKLLLQHNLNLVAYHLPLDAHPEVGNNYGAARDLGLVELEPFGEYSTSPIGVKGRFADALTPTELKQKVERYYGQPSINFLKGPSLTKTVGIVSGGAAAEFQQAILEGLDCYITGEAAEPSLYTATESGTHFFAVGHYASEKIGISKLGAKLQAMFPLAVTFIDNPNPV